tara:strand:- start:56 stop:2107 length:2052 start_codon:yes stop_codon:yes gene_type:complete
MIKHPTKLQQKTIKTMVIIGLSGMLFFLWNITKSENIGNIYLYLALMTTLLFLIFKVLHEWVHYLNITLQKIPTSTKKYTVDILTTFCPGEPYKMIEDTLKAIKAIEYPHQTYLCDEANDPYLIKLCDELDVIHVTRTNRINAKAGNINNALKQATGEICVILDPDHVPLPNFLEPILPYFDDDKIGFVQIVQHYKNIQESIVSRGAAQQSFHFYGPMMMSMNKYGTVQAIGANCTFRRKALDSIGGHAAGLAEDMHTAMQLHAKGWKSVYVPQILAKGLVPSTLSSYYMQQLKWSRGVMELLLTTYIQLFKKFTFNQKLHYGLLPGYYLGSIIYLINFIIPIIAITMAQTAIKIDLSEFMILGSPWFISIIMIRLYVQRWVMEEQEKGFHLFGGLMLIGTWWIHLTGVFFTLIRKKVPYDPTPKDDSEGNKTSIIIPNLIILIISLSTLFYASYIEMHKYFLVMKFMLVINSLILLFNISLCFEKQIKTALKMVFSLKSAPFSTNLRKLVWIATHWVYNVFRIEALALVILSIGFTLMSIQKNETFKFKNIKNEALNNIIYQKEQESKSNKFYKHNKLKILTPSIVLTEGLKVKYSAIYSTDDKLEIIKPKSYPEFKPNWFLVHLDKNKEYYRYKYLGNSYSINAVIPKHQNNYRILLEANYNNKKVYALCKLNTPYTVPNK